MIIDQLKLLINLAWMDGEVGERERTYISNIGQANNIPLEQITPLLEQKHPLIIPTSLTPEERFTYIFSLVQLMKIDGRLFHNEVKFCAQVAAKLGYDEVTLVELMTNVKANMEADEKKTVQELVQQYLNVNS